MGNFRVDLPLVVAEIDHHFDVQIAVVKSYEHTPAIERAFLGAHEASQPLRPMPVKNGASIHSVFHR
jgi:hypothetical protein